LFFFLGFGKLPQIESRRVVVTGLGMVCPLGINVESSWNRLIKGDSAIDQIKLFDTTNFPCKVAAVVCRGTDTNQFDSSKWITNQSSTSPFMEFSFAATEEAINDAKYMPITEKEKERTGVTIGSGIGSLDDIIETNKLLHSQGYKKVSPYFIPKILINMAAGHISIKYGFKVI